MRNTVWNALGVGLLVAALAVGCDGTTSNSDDAGSALADSGDAGTTSVRDGEVLADAPVFADVLAVADLDRDDDGVPDGDDALPDDPTEVYDSDGDGVGNLADLDEDGDGSLDVEDRRPFDPAASDYPGQAEVEPNDVPREASAATAIPVRFTGRLDTLAGTSGDVDVLSVPVDDGGGVTFVLRGARTERVSITLQEGTARLLFPAFERSFPDGSRAISVLVDEGPVLLILDDSGDLAGRAAWTVEAFRDDDLDGLDDERERAQGLRAPDADTDDDGVSDFDEVAAPDADGDALPTFLDLDSDGDGLSDGAESIEDDDEDGMPAFLDLDSDGIAPLDAAAGDASLNDLDADGRADYRDVDDDGDGLRDDSDPAPTVALRGTFDPATAIDVVYLETRIGTDRAPDAVVPGETLAIEGVGFGTTADTRVIFGVGSASPVTVVPDSVTATEILVRAPLGAQSSLRVIRGERASDVLPITVIDIARGAPLLFAPSAFSDTTILLRGVNIERFRELRVGDVPVTSSTREAPDAIRVYGTSGPTRIVGALGESNTVMMRTHSVEPVYVTIPGATAATWSRLVVSSSVGDGEPGSVGTYRVPLPTGLSGLTSLSLVAATTTDGLGVGRDCVTVQSFTTTVDPTTTAIALSIELTGVLEQTQPYSHAALLTRLEALPEITALAARITTRLASTACPLDAPDAATRDAIVSAAGATARDVEAGLADGTYLPPGAPSHPDIVLPIHAAIVTPPEASDVSVYQRAGTGHLTVENDTSLPLSARITLAPRGATLVPHVTGIFDRNVIGGQSGVLTGYRASTQDYEAPGYRNAHIEVITPGLAMPQPSTLESNETQWPLALRAALDGIIFPLLDAAIGGDAGFTSAHFIHLVVQQNYAALLDARAAYDDGSVTAFLVAIANVLVRDFDNVGPITRGIARMIGRGVAETVVERIAKRLAAKLVPVVGQLAAILEVGSMIASYTNVAKVAVDLATTPGVLEFEADFGFQLGSVTPGHLERAARAQSVTLSGTGLIARDASGAIARPTVEVRDLGAPHTRTITPEVNAEGTELRFSIPGDYLRAAAGPLTLTVSRAGESLEAAQRIEIEQLLRLATVTPETTGPKQRIVLEGGGFGARPEDAIVYFYAPSSGGGEILVRGRIVAHSPTRLEVITHWMLENEMPWEVGVDVAGLSSNRLPLNARPFDLDSFTGTVWNIDAIRGACLGGSRQSYVMVFAPRTVAFGPFHPAMTWDGYVPGRFYTYPTEEGFRVSRGTDGMLNIVSFYFDGAVSLFFDGVLERTYLEVGPSDSRIIGTQTFPFTYLASGDGFPRAPVVSPDGSTIRWYVTTAPCRMPDIATMHR
ncbi:MAG: hypothetical protein J0L92_29065 [Deltaproteobacteria bacterium]|nr:hypothetical protein [Deltaproteobacteria bacterium]